jgi:heme exporter protein CcmD
MNLGQYAFDILLAYALSAALLIGLIVQSIAASRATKKRLEQAEK